MGRGVGEKNPKERLTKKRERANYKKELNNIMTDIKEEKEEFKREMRSSSTASRSASVASLRDSGISVGGSPRVGKYDHKSALNDSKRGSTEVKKESLLGNSTLKINESLSDGAASPVSYSRL